MKPFLFPLSKFILNILTAGLIQIDQTNNGLLISYLFLLTYKIESSLLETSHGYKNQQMSEEETIPNDVASSFINQYRHCRRVTLSGHYDIHRRILILC